MMKMQRMLFLVLSLLIACSVVGSTDTDRIERQLDDYGGDHDMSMEGKGSSGKGGSGKGGTTGSSGKGGSGKGGDDSDDEYYEMSMSMSKGGKGKGKGEGKGKGKGKGSSSKSSKKSSSSSKSSKKSSKKGGSPTAPIAPSAPTGPPSAPTPTTPAPTSENSIPIRAVPYALFYDGAFDRIPTNEEFAEVAELTRVYLEEFMTTEFGQTSLTNLDDFLTFMIRNSFEFGQPVQADYRSTGLFNPSSIFLPTVKELNELIDSAFEGESLDQYMGKIKGLPSANIFSTTTGVVKGLPDVPVPRGTTSGGTTQGSGPFKMGLVAAAAGILVLAAGAALLKRRKNDEELEDPYSGNLKGDAATVAGETCTTSLDGSSVWRKSSPYITNTEINDDEFEDEPLDSDDEQESAFTRKSEQRARSQATFTS